MILFFLTTKTLGKLELSGAYTWLNNVNGNLRFRIPRIKYNLQGSYEIRKEGRLGIDDIWTGHRRQTDPLTFGTVNTPGFGLVNVTLSQRSGRFMLAARIQNLLDEKYDAILGYTTMGRNYNLSLNVDLGK